jgi:hypothetical protein
MSIVSDNPTDAAQLPVDMINQLPWTIHFIGDHKPPVPPCVIVQWPRAVTHAGMLDGDCPAWAWEVDLLAVASSTWAKDLAAMQTQIMAALHKGGVRVTADPRTYNRPDDPAPLPAVLITCT